jgi:acylglycerol lipase
MLPSVCMLCHLKTLEPVCGLRSLVLLLVFVLTLGVAACAPVPVGMGETTRPAELRQSQFITADNSPLPLRVWNSKIVKPEAVIVALHGFNDYSNAFDEVADYWARKHRIYTYAYDQRGFGGSADPGSWAGTVAYVQDLRDFCDALRKRFPDVPLYVLGSSMGGAIAMVAFASDNPPDADGVILSAPAVWAREIMPWPQRAALFFGARIIPWVSFTGESLSVVASDNRDMLMALGQDSKVIKATKVATLYGLTNLMDEALRNAAKLNVPALVLIGKRDEIIPNHASAVMLKRLQDNPGGNRRTAIYDRGYHLLLRDLQRRTVWNDVAAWIKSPGQPLPSGADNKNLEAWVKLSN